MNGLPKRIANLISEYTRYVDMAASITPIDGLKKRFLGQPKTTTGISQTVTDEMARGDLEMFYQKGKQIIELTYTRCSKGGGRLWFKCPACGKRCGKLYCPLFETDYFCRECHGLVYRSKHKAATIQEIDSMLEILLTMPKLVRNL